MFFCHIGLQNVVIYSEPKMINLTDSKNGSYGGCNFTLTTVLVIVIFKDQILIFNAHILIDLKSDCFSYYKTLLREDRNLKSICVDVVSSYCDVPSVQFFSH